MGSIILRNPQRISSIWITGFYLKARNLHEEKMKTLACLALVVVMALTVVGCSTRRQPNLWRLPRLLRQRRKHPHLLRLRHPEAGTTASNVTWPSKEDLFVGYSQADLASTWRRVESDDMQAGKDERGYKIAITNAGGDTERQISDENSFGTGPQRNGYYGNRC